MPVPTETMRPMKRVNRWFAVSSIVALLSVLWMIRHDYARQWHTFQRNFFNVRSAMAHFEMLRYETPKEQERFRSLQEAVAQAEAELATPEKAAEVRQLLQEEKDQSGRLQGVQLAYGNMNAEFQVKLFNYEEARTLYGPDDPRTVELKESNDAFEAELHALKGEMDALTDQLRATKDRIKALYARKTESEKALAAYTKGRDDARRQDLMYGPGFMRTTLNLPILDMFPPKGVPGRLEVRQVFSKPIRFDYNFVDSYVTDRCTTCHVGIDNPDMTLAAFVRRTETAMKVPQVQTIIAEANRDLLQTIEQRMAEVGLRKEFASKDVAEMDEATRAGFVRALVRAANDGLNEVGRPSIDAESVLRELASEDAWTRSRVDGAISGRIQRILNAVPPTDPVSGGPMAFNAMSERQQMTYVASLAAAMNEYLAEQGRPPIDFSKEIQAHPHLDLFVGPDSAHPMKKMGCTVCHEGAGQDTDFVLAAHTPESHEEKERWEEEYYVRELGIPLSTFHLVEEFWERPMLLKEYTSASCRKCHDQVYDLEFHDTMGLPAASNLVEGRDLFTQIGCINCHLVQGLGDSRKVGTDLSHVGQKLTTGFIERWVQYPKNFRPSTWMPHFFLQENNLPPSRNEFDPDPLLRTETEIQAITHYLTTFSLPTAQDALPEGMTGDPGRGEQLFTSIGCLACHVNLAARDPLSDSGQTFGERWIVTDLMMTEDLSEEDARARYDAMGANERARYAYQHFPPQRRDEALKRSEQEAFRADLEGRDPDPKLMYVPPAFTRFAPELSGMGTKLVPDPNDEEQVRRATRWLYNWLRDPRMHSSYTKMPRMFRENYYQDLSPDERQRRNDQDMLDIAAYLITLRNDDFDASPISDDADHRTMAQHLILDLLAGQNTKSVADLILNDGKVTESDPYGRLTEAVVQQTYRSFGGGDEGRQRVAAIIAERSGSLADRQKLFLGMKMISHYGCYACHQIAGFEDATRPGTELTTWAQKFMSQLDFAFFAPTFEHEIAGMPEIFGNLYIEAPAYEHLIRDAGGNQPAEILHNHGAFAYHKLRNPRIFDRQKVKKPYEKLKMPNFYLSDGQTKALTTYLLSLRDPNVWEEVKVDYAATPMGRIAAGRRLVRELNCVGCHAIEEPQGYPNVHQYYSTDPTLDDNNPVGQRFLPPLLWGEGAKIQNDWLFTFLSNVEMLRPWLHLRMPSFHLTTDQATALVGYFAGVAQEESDMLDEYMQPIIKRFQQAHAGFTGVAAPAEARDWFLDDRLSDTAAKLRRWSIQHRQQRRYDYDAGGATDRSEIVDALSPGYDKALARADFLSNLFGVAYPFTDTESHVMSDDEFKRGEEFFYDLKCLACHVAGDPSVPGTTTDIKAPNFALTHKRLRYDWVIQWLQDPQAIQPGANMPQIFQGGSAYAMMPPETRREKEGMFGPSVDKQATLLVDFLFSLGERRYTAIQPGGLGQPGQTPTEDVEFDFEGGDAEPEFDFDSGDEATSQPSDDVEFDF